MKEQVIHNQPSFILANEQVSVAITERGGHGTRYIGGSGGQRVTPYYISPWQDEHEAMPADVLIPYVAIFSACRLVAMQFHLTMKSTQFMVKRQQGCGLLSTVAVLSLVSRDWN